MGATTQGGRTDAYSRWTIGRGLLWPRGEAVGHREQINGIRDRVEIHWARGPGGYCVVGEVGARPDQRWWRPCPRDSRSRGIPYKPSGIWIIGSHEACLAVWYAGREGSRLGARNEWGDRTSRIKRQTRRGLSRIDGTNIGRTDSTLEKYRKSEVIPIQLIQK